MSWLELDDGILDHPKFIRAVKLGGSEAVHLWLSVKAYCNKQLTDGHVPEDMLDEVRGPKDAKKRATALAALIEVNLLEKVADGVQMHNYLKWSRSRADVLESRRKNSERQAKSRGSHAVTDAATARAVTPSVTTPSPLLSLSSSNPSPSQGESAREPVSETKLKVPGARLTSAQRQELSLQPAAPEDVAVLEAWRDRFKKTGVFFTADRAVPLAERRAEDMTHQDALDALEGAAADDWFLTQGAKVELVFGNRSRFEAYRDAGRAIREGKAPARRPKGAPAPRQPDSGTYSPLSKVQRVT